MLAALLAVAVWISFAAFLIGALQPDWLPEPMLSLSKPSSLADFGQAFSALDGLVSSFALMLGLIAVVMQTKQSADSNAIGALTARLQFLLAEGERLEEQIQSLKARGRFDRCLFDNMVSKKTRQLREAEAIDNKLRKLLAGP